MSNGKAKVFVGIDVSARQFVVAWQGQAGVERFSNDASGHRQLIKRLGQAASRVRVVLEASGNYSLDLALSLSRATEVEVVVANPRAARRFAESLGKRSKTDPVDAHMLAEFAARMPATAWQAPSPAALQLRVLARTVAALTRIGTQQKNREHAVEASVVLAPMVARELARHTRYLERRITQLRRKAQGLVQGDPELQRRWQQLLSIPGVGEASALALLGELVVLPPALDARQWVAHCGLDPKQHESGSSVHVPTRISKAGNRYLRAALYMPALVAVQCQAEAAAFYQRLQGRGKAKLAALTAVMRKLLHGIYGMFRQQQNYDAGKLFPVST